MDTALFAQLKQRNPAAALLLACARDSGEGSRETISGLAAICTDWDEFLRLAFSHRMIPSAYRALSRIEPLCLPLFVLARLKSQFQHSSMRNLLLTAELLRLLDVLNDNGVPSIPFKGPTLATMAYGDLSMRQFGDLDILINPDNLQKARVLMQAEGYRLDRDLTPSQEAAFIRSDHAYRFLLDEKQIAVEIHWRLDDRHLSFSFGEGPLWDRAESRKVFGRELLCLGSDDLFIYLCMHGAKHYWESLEWICCMTALIRVINNVDWPKTINSAAKLGGRRLLHLGLLLADDLESSDISKTPLRLMRPDPIARELADTVWKEMFSPERQGAAKEVYRYSFYLKARERVVDRMRVMKWAAIRTPHPDSKDWKSLPVPESMTPVYYVARPIRLLKQHGLRSLKEILYPKRTL